MEILNKPALKAAIAAFATALKNDDGVLISSMTIDPVLGELLVDYNDGNTVNLGVIAGEDGDDGDDGVAVIDVQLVADELQDGDVFIQTTLSNGIVLQTSNSLSGYNGESITDAYIQDNNLVFTLGFNGNVVSVPVLGLEPGNIAAVRSESGALIVTLANGEELPPVPVTGITTNNPVSATIRDGNLFIELEDGTELDSGAAAGLKARSVVGFTKEEGKLYVTYDDAPEDKILLGDLNGIADVSISEGNLVITMDSGDEADLGQFLLMTGAEVRENELILLTNQPGEAAEINLGPVANLKGDKGVGVSSVVLENNALVITLTDGNTLDPLPVEGLNPISILGARYDSEDTELYLQLTDGSEISTGISDSIRGRGIVDASFDPVTGEITIRYSDETEDTVIGTLPVITDMSISETGQLTVTWSNDPENPVELTTIKSIVSITTDETGKVVAVFNDESEVDLGTIRSLKSISTDPSDGAVKAIYSDDEEQELGVIRSIESAAIVDGKLELTYTGGDVAVVGQVLGKEGNPGNGIKSVAIDDAGNLIVTRDDNTTIDAGLARTTILNLLGKTKEIEVAEGQTTFEVAHDGTETVLAFRNGQAIDNADLDFSVPDQIGYAKGSSLTEDDLMKFVIYVPGGPSETGRGVFEITSISDTAYQITLEDGSTQVIETYTEVNPDDIPAAIVSAEVQPTGELVLKMSKGPDINAGLANKAINVKKADINDAGNLIITLDDDTEFNAGNVVSDLTINDVEIDENGHLIVTLNTGSTFDAGVTGTYITEASINENDVLLITLSSGEVIDAGSVRNPLLGARNDFVAFEGQTEFPVRHEGYELMFYANGVSLSKESLILDDPDIVEVINPRSENDIITVLLMSAGNSLSKGLQSEADAPNDTSYGKDHEGNVGWLANNRVKMSTPHNFKASEGQVTFNIIHSGVVNVFVNGALKTEGYDLPSDNRRVIFDEGLSENDEVMVEVLTSPASSADLLSSQYARVGYETYQYGGSSVKGKWQIRQLNAIVADAIGIQLLNNRLILPKGKYYIRGYGVASGILQNAMRLYNQTYSEVSLQGGASFAPRSAAAYSTPESKTELTGYFEVMSQSAMLLQHNCSQSVNSYGFGTGSAGGRNSPLPLDFLGIPSRLVDLEIWKVG